MVSLGSTRALAYAPNAGKLVKVADVRGSNPTGHTDVPISPLQFSTDSGRTWTVETYPSIGDEYKGGFGGCFHRRRGDALDSPGEGG